MRCHQKNEIYDRCERQRNQAEAILRRTNMLYREACRTGGEAEKMMAELKEYGGMALAYETGVGISRISQITGKPENRVREILNLMR